MKIDNRSFPYPVLSETSRDYERSMFKADCSLASQAVDHIDLSFELMLQCDALQDLLARGSAEYAVHIECPATSYRELLRRKDPSFVHAVSISKLKGRVECTALIIASDDINGFKSTEFAPYFDNMSFEIPRGGIIAFNTMPSIIVPEPALESGDGRSVIIVYKLSKTGDAHMTVDIEGDSINIGLAKTEYDAYVRMSVDAAMLPLLNSMLVLPALIYALEQLRDEDVLADCESLEWYRTLSDSMRKRDIDLKELLQGQNDDNRPLTTVEIAQDLMSSPIKSAFRSIAYLDRDEDESENV